MSLDLLKYAGLALFVCSYVLLFAYVFFAILRHGGIREALRANDNRYPFAIKAFMGMWLLSWALGILHVITQPS